MNKAHSNTFSQGLQTDLDKSIVPNNTFSEGFNVQLVGDGKFLALENLLGTTELHTVDASFTGEVLGGPYTLNAKISGTVEPCLLFFTKEGTTFSIYLYRINSASSSVIYTETYSGTETQLVDGVVYPENGIDIVYFTDGANELRKLRLEFPSGVTPFTAQQISLQRRAPLGNSNVKVYASGGSLATGSYQFSYRFYNNVTKSYSKWSLPSIPHIVTKSGTFNTAYYGLNSNKKITIDVTPVTSELSVWTHLQVAVIENTTETTPITASLQPITPLIATTFYDYTSNDSIGTISLTDIVVDQAAIEYCKTLAVKNNRIFAGNIKYRALDYDRSPSASGAVLTTATSQDFSGPILSGSTFDENVSKYRGYMRGEVYRFYASYFDDKYNFSRPKRLNLSVITDNQTANGDIKFPEREGGYTLMTGLNNYLQLGLDLTINNHPSWARGLVIFRAKRKKKKLFQTPLIPSVEIQGAGAVGDYPNIAFESNPTVTEKEYPAAEPMNPSGTLMPKSLFYIRAQHIMRRTNDETTFNTLLKGECQYVTSDWYRGVANSYYFIYDPRYLYGLGEEAPTAADSVNIVDFAFTRLDYTEVNTAPTGTFGTLASFNYLNTSLHGTFYANRNTDYFKTFGTSPAYPLGVSGFNVIDYKTLTNYGEGTTLGGSFVGQFQNLETPGISFAPPPNNQKTGVVQVDGATISDFTEFANTIKPGSVPLALYNSNRGANQPISLNSASNTSFISSVSFTENNTYCQTIAIANIENGLGDDRYGTEDTIHELVLTNTYTFTDAELPTVVANGNVPKAFSVYGGDTWVSTHSFKLTDGHYALTNDSKQTSFGLGQSQEQLIAAWNRFFYNVPGSSGQAVCMPVPLKTVSQVLSVVLESEANGQITAPLPYTAEVPTDIPTSTTESQWKIAFPYLYNKGVVAASDQKVLIPYNANELTTNRYPARALYSDQKVYATDIQGFDSFPVANFVDLEETYGGITKLGLAADNLYALQERGVALIPVDASTLSTTDAQTISVRSGTTDIPIYLSRINGCQHIKAVQVLSDKIIFPDNRTAQVFVLGGQELVPISEKGAAFRLKQKIGSTLAANALFSAYDEIKRQYYLFKPDGFCLIWDDRLGVWQDQLELSTGTNRFYGAVRASNILYGLGRDGSALKLSSMYTGSPNQFWGATVTPRVTFTVNPDYQYNKTFDNLIAYASDPLATADISGERETGATGFVVTGMNFDVARREGYYIIPVLRDSNGARIRSTRADVTIKWPTDAIVSLSEVVTKYRPSSRWPEI